MARDQDLSILEVALPVPMNQLFDYLPPLDLDIQLDQLRAGLRVRVPFGQGNKKQLIGVITRIKNHSDYSLQRLKRVQRLLDEKSLIDQQHLDFLLWAARYYHHPPGQVLEAALPNWLRKKEHLPKQDAEIFWSLTPLCKEQCNSDYLAQLSKKATKQALLLKALDVSKTEKLSSEQLNREFDRWRDSMQRLEKKGWVHKSSTPIQYTLPKSDSAPTLHSEQSNAIQNIHDALDKSTFQSFLLDGITGSGKTEVYLAAAQSALRENKQVLCLIPEIALTPQLVERFEQRLQTKVCLLHSGLNDKQRALAWLSASIGEGSVILGTRSAIFTPAANLGLIIVDEEHDTSFKQESGFRYSARDLAVVRAKKQNAVVILGSATPSLESQQNCIVGEYKHLKLKHRPNQRTLPKVHLVDLKKEPVNEGLSYPLLNAMEHVLEKDEQVLVFLNRRGYAPVWLCTHCFWSAKCSRCDSNYTYHLKRQQLQCHHCAKVQAAPKQCPNCNQSLKPVGEGTERIESFLQARFHKVPVLRIDRDTTRRTGEFIKTLNKIKSGGAQILVGTQLLTKGHDFPNVTLVGVLNADSGLFSSDFRSSERLSQQLIQVAGRAGRANKAGIVMIQTLFPEHPLMQELKDHNYPSISQQILSERQNALWPPFAYLGLLRAEAQSPQAAQNFLGYISKQLEQHTALQVEVLGPAPAPQVKRAGYFRSQLLFRAKQRASLHQIIYHALELIKTMPNANKVRWSLDIDPSELY